MASLPLVVRLNSSDDGVRPPAPGVDFPFWTCESISMTGPPGEAANLYDPNMTAVGRTTTVNVAVWNKGSTRLEDVNVEAWVFNFTAGYVGPGSNIIRDPVTGQTFTFTGYLPSLDAGQSSRIACSPTWTPTAEQARINEVVDPAGVHSAHVCIGANAYANGVGASLTTGGVDPVNNSQQGWRNISILAVARGSEARLARGIMLDNPRGDRDLDLTVDLIHVPDPLTPTEIEHIRSGPYGRRQWRRSPLDPIDFDIDDQEDESLPGERDRARQGRAEAIGRAGDRRPRRRKRRRMRLRKNERRRVLLKARLREDEEPGNLHTFDAVTRDADGSIIGGARLLVLIDR
jgi:hypothetical protein